MFLIEAGASVAGEAGKLLRWQADAVASLRGDVRGLVYGIPHMLAAACGGFSTGSVVPS